MARKRYRGKITDSCFTAVVVSKLMGCSITKTKTIIKLIKEKYGYINEELLGMAIQEVRNQQDLKR